MSVGPRPGEDELHACIDGELPADRRDAVAAYLRDHPADAKRLAAYRADGAAIARLFARMPPPSDELERVARMLYAGLVES